MMNIGDPITGRRRDCRAAGVAMDQNGIQSESASAGDIGSALMGSFKVVIRSY
jgi:hypothetical protein